MRISVVDDCSERREYTKTWWKKHYGYALPELALSKNCISIDDDNGYPILIGYLYPSIGSEICWLGFIVSDPAVSKIKIGKALLLLFETAMKLAKSMGYSILYTTHESRTLHKVADEMGFVRGDSVVAYWKGLKDV